eukprot:COSAG02_NODE_12005_length_1614_cov_57.281961_1_plen_419_part_00
MLVLRIPFCHRSVQRLLRVLFRVRCVLVHNRRQFAFCSQDFTPQAYYYECVDLLRKMCMSGVLTLIATNTVFQAFVSVVFSLIFLGIQIRLWPYNQTSANVLRIFTDIEVFLVTLVGLILRIAPEELAKDTVRSPFQWTGTLYGDLLWVMLVTTLFPIIFACLYRSNIEKAQITLQKLARVVTDDDAATGGNSAKLTQTRKMLGQHNGVARDRQQIIQHFQATNEGEGATARGQDRVLTGGTPAAHTSDVATTAEEWVEHFSAEHQRSYWVNRHTNQSRWTEPLPARAMNSMIGPHHAPANRLEARRRLRVSGAAATAMVAIRSGPGRAQSQAGATPLPDGWRELEHQGRTYYLNNHTGETTWSRPDAHASGHANNPVYDSPQEHPRRSQRQRSRVDTVRSTIVEPDGSTQRKYDIEV